MQLHCCLFEIKSSQQYLNASIISVSLTICSNQVYIWFDLTELSIANKFGRSRTSVLIIVAFEPRALALFMACDCLQFDYVQGNRNTVLCCRMSECVECLSVHSKYGGRWVSAGRYGHLAAGIVCVCVCVKQKHSLPFSRLHLFSIHEVEIETKLDSSLSRARRCAWCAPIRCTRTLSSVITSRSAEMHSESAPTRQV